MTVMAPTTSLAMTDQQHRDFDERGFILLENFFTPTEFDRLLAAIDEVAARIRAEKGLSAERPVCAAQRADATTRRSWT